MCRFSLTVCLALTFALPSNAQDAKPNTLTPKEIADGWILLFDGETTFGWKSEGAITAKDGMLVMQPGALLWPTSRFGNYEMMFECSGGGSQKIISLDKFAKKDRNGAGHHSLNSPKEWRRVNVKFKVVPGSGGGVTGRLTNIAGIQHESSNYEYPSDMQHWLAADPAHEFMIRNVKLRPLKTQSLFTGRDLSGWTIFPGKKSEFAVIDGAINIKNGPGDLQTEKKFGDFCLQLECISHGAHLNSGVFFRCRPNEYQNGYEAQINNHFAEKPRKYLIEEYDPKTHKLLDKKESFFAAVDFGTGAIYRRQPARKGMAKDNEWFTMTVVAHGNHFATWVNGIQVTDWYDNRPPSDNARTGYRAEAGHISLQGHDPTTNLSFRNFRIQEYPPAK